MEPIKVSINVNLDLSEEAKSFISNLVVSFLTSPAAPAPKPAAPAPKPVAQAPTSKPVAQAPTSKPVAQAPAPKPADEESNEISIEDVRKALSLKVNSHRSEIKDKLTELGAPSVTKLDPSLYQEMLDFLNALD